MDFTTIHGNATVRLYTHSMRLLKLSLALALLAQVGVAAAQQVWSMEGHDRWGTNRAPVGPAPADITTPWVYKKWVGGIVSHGTALDGLGNAYYPIWVNNLVVKMEEATGATIGSFATLDYVQSTPALSPSGDAVYIAINKALPFAPPGRIYKITTSTMDYDWFFQTDGTKINDYEAASPMVGPDGDVVFGSTAGKIWRLDDVTGLPVWSRTGLSGISRTVVFSRDDAKVFVASGTNIMALNYSDGTTAWSTNLGSAAGAPGCAPDGTLILGSSSGTVYGINPGTGAVIWQKATLDQVLAAPAFSDTGVAYIGGYDHRLYAYRVTDGFRFWSYTSNHELRAPCMVDANGRIYVNSRTGQFDCVSPSGTLVWSRIVSGDSRGPMSMGADGTIFIGINGPATYAMIRQIRTQYTFDRLSMVIGDLLSGGIANVHTSDDSYATAKPPASFTFGRNDPQIQMNLEMDCPQKKLLFFTLRVEAACTLGPTVTQKVELFNNVSNSWEVVDSRLASNSDVSFDIVLNTNATRFVNAGNGLIKARMGWYIQNGPRVWQSRVDQFELIDVTPDFVL